jgi:hypothetical protein
LEEVENVSTPNFFQQKPSKLQAEKSFQLEESSFNRIKWTSENISTDHPSGITLDQYFGSQFKVVEQKDNFQFSQEFGRSQADKNELNNTI